MEYSLQVKLNTLVNFSQAGVHYPLAEWGPGALDTKKKNIWLNYDLGSASGLAWLKRPEKDRNGIKEIMELTYAFKRMYLNEEKRPIKDIILEEEVRNY